VSAGAGPRFEVRVVDEVLTEDLARCTPAARAAIEPMVATLRDSGAPASGSCAAKLKARMELSSGVA
jgi:hypothetical protein